MGAVQIRLPLDSDSSGLILEFVEQNGFVVAMVGEDGSWVPLDGGQ